MYLILLIFWFIANPDAKVNKRIIIKEKQIIIQGTTSIGAFSCDYCTNGRMDTLYTRNDPKSNQLQFAVPVKDFSCGNFLLNRDFRKTIKADDYPHTSVNVENLQPCETGYTSNLTVTIAGKSLYFEDFRLVEKHGELHGELRVNFSELDLRPPQKLGGLVKVGEYLDLEIVLVL